MEDIIKRIINIEEKAQQIVENTAAEEKEFEETLRRKVAGLHQEIQAKADAKISQLNSQENAGDAETEAKLRASAEKSAASMRRMYEQKKDEWVDSIFSAIVGR